MRPRYLFAALKNHLDPEQTLALALGVRDALQPTSPAVVGLSPSAAALAWVSGCRSRLALAAQNCGWSASYALTGELSVRDLEVFCVRYCLVGHSERRLHLGETEAIIVARLSALFAAQIMPILCVGETLAQRQEEATDTVLRRQLISLQAAFRKSAVAPDPTKLIIAYEPMWAISTSGSNQTAEPHDAVEVHGVIRQLLEELFGPRFGASTSVIFGGGLSADNARDFLSQPGVDGALVGGGMQTQAGFLGVLDAFYATLAAAG
jgi:triosephosphate isomerase